MIGSEEYIKQIINFNCNKTLAEVFREFSYKKGYTFGPHKHRRLEINIVRKGYCTMKFDDQVVGFHKNDCMIVFPDVEHYFEVPTTEAVLVQLEFNLDIFPEIYSKLEPPESLVFLSQILTNSQKYIKISRNPEITELIKKIVREIQEKKDNYEELTKIYYLSLFLLISRQLRETLKISTNLSNPIILKALDVIHDDSDKYHNPNDIATACGISGRYLRKLFKVHINMSPIDYLLMVRVARAKELLYDESLSIKEIAYSTGFTSQQYFTYIFKKITGITPASYKKDLFRNSN